MTEMSWLLAGAFIAALVLGVGHWFPWKLPRLGAYVYGVIAILGGFTIWRGAAGDWWTVAGLALIIATSGVAVFVAYGIDWLIDKIRKANKAARVLDK